MLNSTTKVAICLPTESAMIDPIKGLLKTLSFQNVINFPHADAAYEAASRSQFGLFIVSLSEDDHDGIVLLQRLRGIGNYGFEAFLFLGEKINQNHLALFLEYEVDYALTYPLTLDRVQSKLKYIMERENQLTEEIKQYRSAKAALHAGILDMAEELAKSLLLESKLLEKTSILLADVAFKRNDLAAAEQLYQKVIGSNPLSLAAQHKLAQVYMQQSRYEESKLILDDLAKYQPFHITILENAGLTNLELGYLDLAMEQMQQLQTLAKDNKVAGSVITQIQVKQGNFRDIAANLRLSHDEGEMVALLNKVGIALAHEQNYNDAVAVYKDCLAVVSRDDFRGKVVYNLGLTYQKMGQLDQARDCFLKALKYHPELAKADAMLQKMKKSA
ncbi:MAG: tetratricopeptide repeat protein [Oligoflexus sp.]